MTTYINVYRAATEITPIGGAIQTFGKDTTYVVDAGTWVWNSVYHTYRNNSGAANDAIHWSTYCNEGTYTLKFYAEGAGLDVVVSVYVNGNLVGTPTFTGGGGYTGSIVGVNFVSGENVIKVKSGGGIFLVPQIKITRTA